MRHICLYTGGPDFHCRQAGSPEVVKEALADLKIPKDGVVSLIYNSRSPTQACSLPWTLRIHHPSYRVFFLTGPPLKMSLDWPPQIRLEWPPLIF